MGGSELEELHLAELHRLAAGAGVGRYRLLPRDELVRELRRRGAEAEPAAGVEGEAEAVTGVLDRMPQGFGFLRLKGLAPAEGDV